MVVACCVADEFEDLLGLDEGGHRGVAIDVRSGAASREFVLAVEVGLTDIDRVLAHLDLVVVARIRGAEVGELDLGRVEPALSERERDPVGLGVDVEQRIAGLDFLALDHVDRDDRAR